MAYGDPWTRRYGPIWIDPRFYQPEPWRWRYPPQRPTFPDAGLPTPPYAPPLPAPQPVDEERIRKIVREEVADLPIPFDVPDAPPEDA